MNADHASALLATALFGLGAVALILYNHAAATNKVLAALSPGVAPGAAATPGNGLGLSASLAGSPTPGQTGTSVNPPVVPIVVTPGYYLN